MFHTEKYGNNLIRQAVSLINKADTKNYISNIILTKVLFLMQKMNDQNPVPIFFFKKKKETTLILLLK